MTVEYLAGKRVKGLSTERVLPMSATGGTITTVGNYKVHSFTSSGSFEITGGSGNVEYLVIGGGSGGGRFVGGGGGAGRHLTGTKLNMIVGTFIVTVGAGGAGATVHNNRGNFGASSVFDDIIAITGGQGGAYGQAATGLGNGGGGAAGNSGAVGTDFTGGNGASDSGGGGAGSGGNGANATGPSGGGNGGVGTANSITGSSITRAGGGGGAAEYSGAGTGTNGGGNGSVSNNNASNATGVGSGGGGSRDSGAGGGNGGNGSDGIVIVKYDYVTPTNILTNIQNSTVFEETDTNKSFIFNSSTSTWTQF